MTNKHPINEPLDRLLLPEEVAAEVRLSTRTIRTLIAEGKIKGCKIGKSLRVRRSALDELLNKSAAAVA